MIHIERPFSCDKCPKTFSTDESLDKHQRKAHLGEKVFECNECDKKFAIKSFLTYHQRKHTGEKPYSCDLCDKAFRMKTHLNKHITTKHKSSVEKNCIKDEKNIDTKDKFRMEIIEGDLYDGEEMVGDVDEADLPMFPEVHVKVEIREGVKQEAEG